MMNSAIVRIVDFCARNRWIVIAAGVLLMIATAAYDVARFSINTDVESLISQKLPWHQRQLQLAQAFPQKAISAVVDHGERRARHRRAGRSAFEKFHVVSDGRAA